MAFSLMIALSACGDLPKPFAHEGPVRANPLLKLAGTDAVRIDIDLAVPHSIADPLGDATLSAFKSANIPASRNAEFIPTYILKGKMRIFREDVSDPETVEFDWRLLDRVGKEIKSFNLTITGDQTGWLFFDKELINEIGLDLGTEIASHIHGRGIGKRRKLQIPESNAPKKAIPKPTIPQFFIAEVIGAPGDGPLSLDRALRRTIRKAGGDIAFERPKATYLVKGFVNVSDEIQGTNDIAITWLVTTPEGQELGKVTQNNRVPVGRLNRRWGDIAYIIAEGASVGIIDIVTRNAKPKGGKNGLEIPSN